MLNREVGKDAVEDRPCLTTSSEEVRAAAFLYPLTNNVISPPGNTSSVSTYSGRSSCIVAGSTLRDALDERRNGFRTQHGTLAKVDSHSKASGLVPSALIRTTTGTDVSARSLRTELNLDCGTKYMHLLRCLVQTMPVEGLLIAVYGTWSTLRARPLTTCQIL